MEIKKTIRHENNLEELREEMTERVRHYFPLSDECAGGNGSTRCASCFLRAVPQLCVHRAEDEMQFPTWLLLDCIPNWNNSMKIYAMTPLQ